MKRIPLTKGESAVVDDEDFDRFSRYRWCLHGDGYAARGYNREGKVRIVKLHHEILGIPELGREVDHINGDKLDNRKCNLRFVTHQQNIFNTKKRIAASPGVKPSKYKGVVWRNDRNKWRSSITIDGEKVYLGLFLSEQEAARAYNLAASRLFGEFARLNIL